MHGRSLDCGNSVKNDDSDFESRTFTDADEFDLWAHESGLAARFEGSSLEAVQAEPETSPVGAWLVENGEQAHFLKRHPSSRFGAFPRSQLVTCKLCPLSERGLR